MRLCPESSEMSCPRGTGGEEGKELTYFTLLSSFGCFRVLPWLLAGSARVRRVGVESMNGYCWGWLENLRLWWRLMEVFYGHQGRSGFSSAVFVADDGDISSFQRASAGDQFWVEEGSDAERQSGGHRGTLSVQELKS